MYKYLLLLISFSIILSCDSGTESSDKRTKVTLSEVQGVWIQSVQHDLDYLTKTNENEKLQSQEKDYYNYELDQLVNHHLFYIFSSDSLKIYEVGYSEKGAVDSACWIISIKDFTLDKGSETNYWEIYKENGEFVLHLNDPSSIPNIGTSNEVEKYYLEKFEGTFPPTEWEQTLENDTGDSLITEINPQEISVGSINNQYVITPNDTDWFQFEASENSSYLITLENYAGLRFELINDDGSKINDCEEYDEFEDSLGIEPGNFRYLQWDCNATSSYKIKVFGYFSKNEGNYNLSIRTN